jgi:hypothetical protein
MKITVIGEICTDIFVYGETKRLSPEAPVPVFNPLFTDENPGMAGNAVENLKPFDNKNEIKSVRHSTSAFPFFKKYIVPIHPTLNVTKKLLLKFPYLCFNTLGGIGEDYNPLFAIALFSNCKIWRLITTAKAACAPSFSALISSITSAPRLS